VWQPQKVQIVGVLVEQSKVLEHKGAFGSVQEYFFDPVYEPWQPQSQNEIRG